MADRRAPVEAATPAADHDLPLGTIRTVGGVEINMGELVGGEARAAGQGVLDGRQDFHTHPRSLALGHMQLADWRTHEKLRTVGALLVVCLNLGTDPPGIARPKERAVLEAWVDPNAPVQAPTQEEIALHAASGHKSGQSAPRERTPLKAIAENLQRQYELIHRHAKFKTMPDCTLDDLRKYCPQYRRMAKDERLLFHYNGHGVPYPSASGDIWVFNTQFTQYIPVSAMDLMGWIGTPCVYVWDCSNAMSVVQAFHKNAKARDVEIARIRLIAENAGAKLPLSKGDTDGLAMLTSKIAGMMSLQAGGSGPGQQTAQSHQQHQQPQQPQQQPQQPQQPPINRTLINLALLPAMHHEDIHFAACGVDEVLPSNPELPADLFTSCLTTPVKAAVRYWVIRNPHTSRITLDECEKLMGSVQERRTPMGELNWIFTSITDTIAWNTLPRELFRKLFRQDVVVASLYRNFMLADRIMRFYGVRPECSPVLPPTHKHPLWDSLDLEIDMCLAQLPRLLEEEAFCRRQEERAKQSERDRLKRATLHAQQRGGRGPAAAPVPVDFEVPTKIKLEIAGEFKKRRQQQQRSRSRLGAESDESDAGSGYDSDGVGPAGGGGSGGGVLGGDVAVTGYISSTYFSNQLYAFEVWLQHAATVVSQFVVGHGPNQTPRSLSTEPPPGLDPPGELPAVLQVLLSQQYRLRALILLYRFMNLGPWAVDLAMAVGIYPYMTKLLASTTAEIREILILVWARLVAVDPAMHPELLKSEGLEYFAAYLANNIQMQSEPVSDKVRLSDGVSAASAFTLAMLCRNMAQAQHACFNERVLDYFLVYLQHPDNGTEERANLRTWILMCLGELWRGFSNAKWMAMTYRLCVIASKKQQQVQEAQELARQQQQQQQQQQQGGAAAGPSFEELLASSADDDSVDARDAHDLLIQMAFHRSPTVRAAAVYAMGTLLEDLEMLDDDPTVLTIIRKGERQLFALLLQAASDGSPVVRREVAAVIGSAAFASYMPQAVEAVARVVAEDMREHRAPQPGGAAAAAAGSPQEVSLELLIKLYKTQLRLSVDPHPDVASVARDACDVLMQCYAHSRAFVEAEPALDQALQRMELTRAMSGQAPGLDAVYRAGSNIGDALLGLAPPANGAQAQQPQQPQQQQPLSPPPPQLQRGSRARHAPGGLRGRDGAPAHHRYTMHVPQGSAPHAGLFGARSPPTPRSPSAAGSISAASLATIEPPRSSGSGQRASGLGWLAALEGHEREEAMRRLGEIERAWLEWGRLELRENACVSTLLDWAGAYYTEFDISLFADVSGPLQSSATLVEDRERSRQARRVAASARVLDRQAATTKWTDVRPVGCARDAPVAAVLHPLEPHAIVAGARGTVAVFDWECRAQVGQFEVAPRARCPDTAAVASLHLVNPLGETRLLVGSQDGCVRIFASHAPDFAPPAAGAPAAFPRPQLLSAFVALPWSSRGPAAGYLGAAVPGLDRSQQIKAGAAPATVGLATAWNQRSGTLFAGGDPKEVRVWDVAAEMCVEEIAVASMGGVTSIGSSSLSDTVFVVGMSNGVVRVVDRRLAARQSVVASWREHMQHAVRSVRMRLEQMEVVSACESGIVKTWDLRHKEPVYTLDTLADPGADVGRRLVAMDVHESAAVTLTASESAVRIWNQRGLAIGAAAAASIAGRSANSTTTAAAAYVKSLAGYGPARAQAAQVSAAALHTYLPVALLATDDGRVGIVQASQRGARPTGLAAGRAHSAL